MKTFGIVLAVGMVAWACDVQAGIRHCDQCGCRRNCKKYCRLVCGTKTETKTVYSCESEDFCVPGPSIKCGVKIECDCEGHKHRRIIWKPTCAKVRTKKNLVKKEVKKEVPDYKWVVEEICRGCGHCVSRTEHTEAPSQANMADDSEERTEPPPVPVPDDSELAPASDQVTPGPDVDEPEPAAEESEPATDKPEPADCEAPQTLSRHSSRFLQVLLNVK